VLQLLLNRVSESLPCSYRRGQYRWGRVNLTGAIPVGAISIPVGTVAVGEIPVGALVLGLIPVGAI